jgi:hypothetical protein
MRAIALVLGLAVLSGCAGVDRRDGEEVIADKRGSIQTCPLHEQPLVEDVVPIRCGWSDYVDSMLRHQPNAPFANFYVLGPCGGEPDGATRARVLYCPECRVLWMEVESKLGGEKHAENAAGR